MDDGKRSSAPFLVSLDVSHVLHLQRRKYYQPHNEQPRHSPLVQIILAVARRHNGRARAVADEPKGVDDIPDNIILVSPLQIVVHPREADHGQRLGHAAEEENDKDHNGDDSQKQPTRLSRGEAPRGDGPPWLVYGIFDDGVRQTLVCNVKD